MTTLYLIRHGQTEWNADGRLQGGSDVPLNSLGRAQAAEVATAMSARLAHGGYVVTSDLARARDTAAGIATHLGSVAVAEPRLRERGFGEWEGTTEPERIAADPSEVARWYRGEEPAVPGFEATGTLAARLVAAAEDAVVAALRADREDVILVSHGSALRVLTNALVGLPLTSRAFAGLGNVRWSELVPSGGASWTLHRHNVGSD